MFKGSITALVTPFRDGAIDWQAFEAFVDWQITEGSHGLVPVGTTGESPTPSHDEHKRVVEACIKVAAGRVPPAAERFFLVDPLDGTKEFIGGNGEFTVNVALIEYGVPVMGVVYAPAIGRLFAGGPDGAAEMSVADGRVGARRPIRWTAPYSRTCAIGALRPPTPPRPG